MGAVFFGGGLVGLVIFVGDLSKSGIIEGPINHVLNNSFCGDLLISSVYRSALGMNNFFILLSTQYIHCHITHRFYSVHTLSHYSQFLLSTLSHYS